AADALSGHFFGATPRRLLGPVEYLAVWHLQRTQRPPQGAEAFRTTPEHLVDLLNHSEEARTLDPRKLAADAQTELERAYTRDRLAAVAAAWKAGKSPADVAQAALDAAGREPPGSWVVRDL